MALFRCIDTSVNKTFVIEVDQPALVEDARKLVADSKNSKGVMGTVIPKPVEYNSPWSWHLEPKSISFFEMAMEVCDANVQYLEKHLSKIGTDFLPNGHWCPWQSKLIEEVERSSLGLKTI